MSETKVKTSFNPAGFIEQAYIGSQTPDSIISAAEELIKRAKRLKGKGEKVLILADLSDMAKIDFNDKMARARKAAIQALAETDYDKLAVYGNAGVQVLVNTLAMIAGERHKIRVFGERIDALKWLKNGG
jgi:hypothetical protein